MPIRIDNTSLVSEYGHKLLAQVQRVIQLLGQPPGILPTVAIVMVRCADPVLCRGVDAIPEEVDERAIASAIPGDFCVPVKISAQRRIRFTSNGGSKSTNLCYGAALRGRAGSGIMSLLGGIRCQRRLRASRGRFCDGKR